MSLPSAEYATLAGTMESAVVDVDVLRRRYKPLLELVRVLIGLAPNCDPYLEIWPIGFRTYNLVVPNLLNLPALIWSRGAPKQALGLAMYASSRAAGCMYCSAHTCTFALRRGSTTAQVAAAMSPKDAPAGVYGALELAAIQFANAVGQAPTALTPAQRDELAGN